MPRSKRHRRRKVERIVLLDESSSGEDDFADNKKETGASEGEQEEDVFHWILKCQRKDDNSHAVLPWNSPRPPMSVKTETALVQDRLLRWGKKERGISKNQPEWRKKELKQLSDQHGVPLYQTLSLRRHHMKRLNVFKPMQALGLGKEEDIRESSRLFEVAVGEFLAANGVGFYSEDEQKAHIRRHRKDGMPFPPTPDFILHQEIIIETFRLPSHKCNNNNNNNNKRNRKRDSTGSHPTSSSSSSSLSSVGEERNGEPRQIIHRHRVCWVDAKMFYGASTIEPDDGKSAVGCLLASAQKYVRVFGPGAFCFLQGYGEGLAQVLAREGVLALDCSGGTVSLQEVQAHQRTWCGDEKGQLWL